MKTVVAIVIFTGLVGFLWFVLSQGRDKVQDSLLDQQDSANSYPQNSQNALPRENTAPQLLEAKNYIGLNLSVIAISEIDHRSVIMSSDGTTQVLELGDKVSDTSLELLQVMSDKIVLQDQSGKGLYFVKKSQGGELSQVMRLVSQPDLRESPYVNNAVPVRLNEN